MASSLVLNQANISNCFIRIKTIKRQAYGFRDPDFLRLKILGIHETTYALVG